MPVDSTTVAVFTRMGELFGLPIGWFAAGIGTTWGLINTIKTLAPNLIQSVWYPVVGFVWAALYCYLSLGPSWSTIVVGTVLIFGLQWIAWIGAKKAAVAKGIRSA
jgi:hypothetical protein